MNRVVYFKGEGVSERPRSIQKVFYVWRKNHDEGGGRGMKGSKVREKIPRGFWMTPYEKLPSE